MKFLLLQLISLSVVLTTTLAQLQQPNEAVQGQFSIIEPLRRLLKNRDHTQTWSRLLSTKVHPVPYEEVVHKPQSKGGKKGDKKGNKKGGAKAPTPPTMKKEAYVTYEEVEAVTKGAKKDGKKGGKKEDDENDKKPKKTPYDYDYGDDDDSESGKGKGAKKGGKKGGKKEDDDHEDEDDKKPKKTPYDYDYGDDDDDDDSDSGKGKGAKKGGKKGGKGDDDQEDEDDKKPKKTPYDYDYGDDDYDKKVGKKGSKGSNSYSDSGKGKGSKKGSKDSDSGKGKGSKKGGMEEEYEHKPEDDYEHKPEYEDEKVHKKGGIPTPPIARPTMAPYKSPVSAPTHVTLSPTMAPIQPTVAPVSPPVSVAPVSAPVSPTAAPVESTLKSIIELAQDAPQLSTLVELLSDPAQEELLFALLGDGPFTVFAPTNDAFENLFSLLGVNSIEPRALTFLLAYHVYEGELLAADLTPGIIVALNNDGTVVSNENGQLVLNGESDVIVTDVLASNGVVHVIDEVLLPPTQNIIELAVAAEAFSTLVGVLDATELLPILEGEGPFTVFAPTDDAFAKLGQDTLTTLVDDIDTLTEILLYHVTSPFVGSGDLVERSSIQSLAEGQPIRISENGTLLNEEVRFLATDLLASNGVVHVIDTVLIPPSLEDSQ